MTNFIPIFPLGIVVYPGESLNLHIFEPRYKQLINECWATKKPFGIPTVINQSMKDLGTLVRVTEISTTYEDGQLDIKTEGLEVFHILELMKEVPDKLYSAAIVNYPANQYNGDSVLMQKLIAEIRALHALLQVQKKFPKPDEVLCSYDLAHHAGLTLQEEYDLLGLLQEMQRQEYLKRHLSKVVPVLNEMNALKKKVQLNGHFKNLESFNL